ncbi:MAG: aquaporin family protein [Bacteroidetes bacterium]|nr:aquaporin family protein [Bacteroidota bacterium]MDA1119681.1 aquaporin family protein [Bacteroidota bacterium]
MNEYLAEFFGTMLLILFGCGVNAGVSLNKSFSQNSGWLVIGIGWGLAVAMGIYAVGSISGAHINPAVTIGLVVSGDFPAEKMLGYIFFQVLGAIVGATIVWLHYLNHWKATKDEATKLGVFATGPAIKDHLSNLLSEIIGTFALVFVIMLIGANEFADGLNPLIVGGLIVAIGISLGGTTGYAINPARDFGPRVAHFLLPIKGKGSSNWRYSWIPIMGPIIGGIQGSLTYNAFFQNNFSAPFYFISFLNIVIIALAVIQNKRE